MRHRGRASAGPHALGGERPDRRVRHAARADAAPVLDPRPHHHDGGPLLRGVGDHAVPLRGRGHAHGRSRRTRCAASRTARTSYRAIPRRLRPRRPVPPGARRPLLRRHHRAVKRRPTPTRAHAGRDGARPRRASRRRAGRSTRSPTPRSSRRSRTSRSWPTACTRIPTGSAKASRRRRAGTKADELGAWECTAVPWFNDPTRSTGRSPPTVRQLAARDPGRTLATRPEEPLPPVRCRTSARPTTASSSTCPAPACR